MDEVESGKHEGGVQVHIIYAVFLCSEWYIELNGKQKKKSEKKERNEMQIQSLALVKPPRSNPLPFHIPFLTEKVPEYPRREETDLVKSLPFDIPEAWKRCPFQVKLARYV